MKIIEIFAEEPRREDKYEDTKIQHKLIVEVYNLNAKANNGFSYEYREDAENHYIVLMLDDLRIAVRTLNVLFRKSFGVVSTNDGRDFHVRHHSKSAVTSTKTRLRLR